MADISSLISVVNGVRDNLSHEVQPALEVISVQCRGTSDEDLNVMRLSGCDRFRQNAGIHRDIADAKQLQPFLLQQALPDIDAMLP